MTLKVLIHRAASMTSAHLKTAVYTPPYPARKQRIYLQKDSFSDNNKNLQWSETRWSWNTSGDATTVQVFQLAQPRARFPSITAPPMCISSL